MADEDDFEIDPDIAAAMGFSGFGTQPNKKRKFNANDAFVDPSASAATGANSIPPQANKSNVAAKSSKSRAPWHGTAGYDIAEDASPQYGSAQYGSARYDLAHREPAQYGHPAYGSAQYNASYGSTQYTSQAANTAPPGTTQYTGQANGAPPGLTQYGSTQHISQAANIAIASTTSSDSVSQHPYNAKLATFASDINGNDKEGLQVLWGGRARNAYGDMVCFLPSFIDDDPWKKLRRD